MQTRPYGKTGYDVSAFGMGCMRLPRIIHGDGRVEVDREKALELIRYAADHGVTYFDTAYSYHAKTSEEVLGEALDGGRRAKVKIATKQPFGVMKDAGEIRRNLENTLKKLRTDYLDVYLIHNIQKGDWDAIKQRDIIGTYEKFKAEGLIRAIGFSYHGQLPAFRDVLAYYDWDMCQVQQNLIDSDKEVMDEAIKLAGKKGTALVIMEPLRGGGLAGAPEPVRKIYDAHPQQRKPVEWAFRYLMDKPEVSTILSGVTTLEQLKENIAIFSQPDMKPGCLSAADRDMLARAKAAYESIVSIPCTACEYCMPCPQGVAIPSVFARYNEGNMFENFDQPRRSYMFMTRGGRDASQCVECGACTPQCPQHIDIIEQLKVAHEALKGWDE